MTEPWLSSDLSSIDSLDETEAHKTLNAAHLNIAKPSQHTR